MRDWVPVAVIAIVFTAFCTAFNLATPYRKPGILLHQRNPDRTPVQVQDVGAPDERQHANYVSTLMQTGQLPVLHPGDSNLYESYQSHQPPLYYFLAAGWCKVTGSDPANPDQGFPLRLLSTLLGVGTLAAIFLGARWAGASLPMAWASCAFVLMPMSVALHSAVSNDPLLFLLCAWTLALAMKGAKEGWTFKSALIVGVLTGLALLTKTTALALVPVVVVDYWATRPKEGATKSLMALFGGMLVVVPIWLRNMSLYGDPFAMKAFNAAFTGSPQASLFIEQLGAFPYWSQMVLWWTARSFIGVFGYMDVFMFEGMGMDRSNALYVALWVVLAIPLAVGAVAAMRAKETKVAVVTNALFLLIVTLLFVRFNMQYFQGQARYLYPALAPLAWCFGLGMVKLSKTRATVSWIVAVAFLVLLDVAAYTELLSGFARRATG
ncbi:MAG: glycosyltransferase family 39 protein [Armatimonadetes bacterium]|nr:glycosyltransferase family 39 protein [Armatimonadota bacterium]